MISKEIACLIFIILINFLTFVLFAIDKSKAKNKLWRIPELTLFLVSFMGGALGALIGMVVFKHKLSKKSFSLGIPALIILNRIMEILVLKILFF